MYPTGSDAGFTISPFVLTSVVVFPSVILGKVVSIVLFYIYTFVPRVGRGTVGRVYVFVVVFLGFVLFWDLSFFFSFCFSLLVILFGGGVSYVSKGDIRCLFCDGLTRQAITW